VVVDLPSKEVSKLQSGKNSLNVADVKNWLRNALIFACPAILVLLASFRNLVPADASWAVVALFVLNLVTDAVRKFVQGA